MSSTKNDGIVVVQCRQKEKKKGQRMNTTVGDLTSIFKLKLHLTVCFS